MASLRRFSSVITVLALTAGASLGLMAAPVQAEQPILQTEGTIVPAEERYTFDGQAGQVVAITLDSDDFDPVLVLFDAAGEEIAFNDDFGNTLNSKIVAELPEDGTYTVLARSYSGQGGDFQVMVRLATPFEAALAAAETLVMEGFYPEAIEGYTEAIALDDTQPLAYLGRAQARLGQLYLEQGDALEGPQDIPAELRDQVIADLEQSATLLDAEGSSELAESLRAQISFLQGDSEGW